LNTSFITIYFLLRLDTQHKMTGTPDALSSDNVVELAAQALRPDATSDFSVKTPYEAVALIGHACMVAVGFRLVGLSEDDTLGL
jgi:hypothetical protein